ALVLAHPTWHAGIIGIVASRLAEQYARPVVLLNSSDPERARGSARSVPGYDIGASIAAQADLLLEHGGHPGAAGLSLHADNIPAFRRRLSNTLREIRDPSIRPGLDLDAYVSLDELSLDLVRELNRLAPFGEGNPRITLATRDLTLKSAAFLGRTKAHRRLTVEDANGTRHTVLWWNSADQPLPDGLFDLAYQLEINTFRDQTELQIVLADYRRSESSPVEVERPRRQVIDLRNTVNQEQQLAGLRQQYPDAAIWAEGYRRTESPGIPLSELEESPVLVIHTTPGSPQTLQDALERADPTLVVLIAIDPPLRAAADIFNRLMQLVKYVINQQAGRTTLNALAEAVAQRPPTIQYALNHLAARGEIAVEYKRGGTLVLAWGNQQPGPDADVQAALAAFQAGVTETAAYRAYFRRADAHKLAGEESEI
ncbi:MAG: hypothetical protein JXQ72_07135, partial [Anaerolineae bacterium]|nr:hypothetical protein [Anaerolineae bacterium]